MALTRTSFLFLSLFSIHHVEATWTPTKPTLDLTCDVGNFDLNVTYAAITSVGYSQSNDFEIGDAANCAETGTSVVSDPDAVAVDKSGLSYGTADAPGCGAGATFTNDATKIEYTAPVKVTMRVTKGNIQRVYIYAYNIKCNLTRSTDVSTTQAFTVTNSAVDETVTPSTEETFDLGVTLEFLDAAGNPQSSSFNVNNMADLTIRIQEDLPAAADLKFTVQRCFASTESSASAAGGHQADIVSNECPVDKTVTITDGTVGGTRNTYTISTRAFSISAADDRVAHYLHCNIFVCLESETKTNYAQCEMEDACPSKRRKRRSVVSAGERERMETITSVQTFTIIDDAYTTDCPDGHVFDTLTNFCTEERVFKIEGVHLDKQWNPEYANTSSTKFKWFAKNTAREIRSLILATGGEKQVRGIKVIAARPGSVILDVLITYGEEVEPREAFEIFKNMLYHTTPQVSRLVNVLNVIKEKTVELVPVEMESKSSLDNNFIIVVVFAVVAVAFISAITLYQVQKLRRRQVPSVAGMTGIENNGMEKA